mmetsp:Transcript_12833/g.21495  ORF Transcript_12833/g.21495 Transcript_12833/m.21495 type:complete len:471 (+) Transcript_12833:151-1563(+)
MTSLRSVVIEIGSVYVKCGFSGDMHPQHIAPHTLPLEVGNLRPKLCELFRNVFIDILNVKSKQCTVLLIESFFSVRSFRDHVVSVLFRDFQVQAVSIQPDLMMGMLATGLTDGVVLNIGSRECQSMAFVDNRPLIHSLRTSAIGVNHAINKLREMLEVASGYTVTNAAAADVFKRVVCVGKENSEYPVVDCTVFPIQGLRDSRRTASDDATATVADSAERVAPFLITGTDRASCLDGLISGYTSDGLCVDEHGGCAGILLESLRACNHDARNRAVKYIIIMGGGAMIPGLCHAICSKAISIANTVDAYSSSLRLTLSRNFLSTSNSPAANDAPGALTRQLPVIAHPSPLPRSVLAWVGGSLFTSLPQSLTTFFTMHDLIRQVKINDSTTEGKEGVTSGNSPGAPAGTGSGTIAPYTPDWEAVVPIPIGTCTSCAGGTSTTQSFLLSAPDWQSLDRTGPASCAVNSYDVER